MGGRGGSSGKGGGGGSSGGGLFDSTSEYGASPKLDSIFSSAYGKDSYFEEDVGAVKSALSENPVVVIAPASFNADPTVSIGGQGSGSKGIYGGVITKEDATHIYLTGKQYHTESSKDKREKEITISKIGSSVNWKREVVQTYKAQKITNK